MAENRKGFMPGCALSSYAPENVEQTLAYLKSVFPTISAIQMCCGKPTKAVGQADLFAERFGMLRNHIQECEINEMIVACQSCMKTLSECSDFKTTSLWELFPKIGLPPHLVGKAKGSDVVFSVHDSCSVRGYHGIHDGIRWIMTELGYQIAEPERTRDDTRCCGFGGMIVPVNPDVAKRVMARRLEDFPTKHIVTYCAACRQSMQMVGGKPWHILDLIWGPVVTSTSPPPEDVLSSPVKAWKNRYKTKSKIKAVMKK